MNQHVATQSPATILTTAEFYDRVHALSPSVAVFDCDGTLWSGDAGSSFMRWTMETGLLSPEATAWLNNRYEGYNRGEVSELEICGEMVQVYRGLSISSLRAAAAQFFRERIEKNIFPEMARLVADLQRDGVDIWAVSSTCDWVIEEGVKRFNIPANRVLAACVESLGVGAAAIATDKLRDVPTDQGKVDALHRVGITHPGAVFGNSVHDAHMLAIGQSASGFSGAFPVNPSADLVRRSSAEGWPVYYPASVAPISSPG
ncbi:MAG: HAD family hydrolase [Acidobacteriota bacterium]